MVLFEPMSFELKKIKDVGEELFCSDVTEKVMQCTCKWNNNVFEYVKLRFHVS